MTKVNNSRFLELFHEFAGKVEAWSTLYLDSIAGYSILYERLCARQDEVLNILKNHRYAAPEFQDTCSISYKSISTKGFSPVSLSPVMKQGDFKRRVSADGPNVLLLGAQCVTSAYAYWEEYLRIEVGKALGVLPADAQRCDKTRDVLNQHVKNDFWGDLRLLRNSIVHNNGIASSEMAKSKLIKWFRPGDKIALNYGKSMSLFFCMGRYRNELHSMSLHRSKGMCVPRRWSAGEDKL